MCRSTRPTPAPRPPQLEAEKTLDELRQLSTDRCVPSQLDALVAIGMGEHDLALDCLSKACADRAQMLSELKVEPLFDPLRSNPRFVELLRHVGMDGAAERP
jgi:hypothetical protein